MKYKGYTGVVEFDEDSGVLFGRVIGLRDLITFEGDSVAEVTRAFHDSVDVYLELCAERGEDPEKPFSGQFVLRIDPGLHRVMSHAAEERGRSLNALVEETLAAAFLRPADAAGQKVGDLSGHSTSAEFEPVDESARPKVTRSRDASPRRGRTGEPSKPAGKRAKGA